jgi:hypothetical protein
VSACTLECAGASPARGDKSDLSAFRRGCNLCRRGGGGGDGSARARANKGMKRGGVVVGAWRRRRLGVRPFRFAGQMKKGAGDAGRLFRTLVL